MVRGTSERNAARCVTRNLRRDVMNSRLRCLAVAALALSLVIPATSNALEKKSVRLQDDGSEWRGGPTSCSIRYYNICTGWVWVWSGWAPQDRVGVHFETCCQPGAVQLT